MATTPPTPSPVPTPDDGADTLGQRQRQALRAHRLQVGGAQRADGMADGLEIIDDVQVLEALRFAERARRERPGAVGELHAVRFDAAGNRHRGAAAVAAGTPGVALR